MIDFVAFLYNQIRTRFEFTCNVAKITCIACCSTVFLSFYLQTFFTIISCSFCEINNRFTELFHFQWSHAVRQVNFIHVIQDWILSTARLQFVALSSFLWHILKSISRNVALMFSLQSFSFTLPLPQDVLVGRWVCFNFWKFFSYFPLCRLHTHVYRRYH